ncbi:hypothetical protein DICPUDRAFT_147081 [Dictyostelium purpureum]|uniref:Intron-binding protein aquarius n=1 Tax=Dictyostelium purpureum TaxID=5786 RepID=F0Z7L9_DICPU|nr:uncharacterized protein DICPUDRAFT_147081 [Dictyostelium purpureum]EGC40086.1 hypothetical protein DICPUDRAFT_147081 [Dictyostelium purpureum]|eukprot:XP_003283435.1 hypothetical protein DICPUDRAFT_147081 [Dictyostelium purpureum]
MAKGNKHNNDSSNNNEIRKKQKVDNGNNENINSNSNNSNNLTLSEVLSDEITKLSEKNWLKAANVKSFDLGLVEKIYKDQILQSNFKIQILELSHYFEHYLWPNFKSNQSSKSLIMSIIIMINEKSKEGLNSFQSFHIGSNNSTNGQEESASSIEYSTFKEFFESFLLVELSELSANELSHYIKFLINTFQSVEDIHVRNECLKIVSYPIWLNLSEGRLDQDISLLPDFLIKKLQLFKKKYLNSKLNPVELKYKDFLLNLMVQFINTLDSLQILKESNSDEFKNSLNYCERFLELMIDLMTQITTRRFFYSLLDDFHLILKVSQSVFITKNPKDSKILNGLLGILKVYNNFDIDNFTGEEISSDQATGLHYQAIQELQKVIFKNFPEIKEIALRNVSFVENKPQFISVISNLSEDRLNELCYLLNFKSKDKKENKQFLISLLLSKFQKKESVVEPVNRMSLYPTEKLLWDSSAIPDSSYRNDRSLALPKLNLQFLSFNDYLMRNFVLVRLESAYEIKQDIEDTVKRLSPKYNISNNKTTFNGWSRMSLPLSSPFKIINVYQANIGEDKPKKVNGVINVSLHSCKEYIKEEWLSVKEHDVLFLVTIQPEGDDNTTDFVKKYGIKHVRGCEVVEIIGEDNNTNSNSRAFKVSLDTNQYQEDLENNNLKLYDSFNIVLRRNPKENNFKSVLDTIISLLNSKSYFPDWLNSIFMGYPSDQQKQQEQEQLEEEISFNDTFLNLDHLKNTYQDKKIELTENCKLMCSKSQDSDLLYKIKFNNEGDSDSILVDTYKNKTNKVINSSDEVVNRNKIEFTPTQISAIKSGVLENKLTLIVGPPGTGKTDIAVQIISNIYHNSPNQRTLIITHSNQALNQLFEKIYNLDINERYLLRLGHGQKQLQTSKDFTKGGRIDFWLNLRISQLEKVDQLAKSIDVADDVSYTCDTALQFFSFHVLSKWEKFQHDLEKLQKESNNNDNSAAQIKYIIENYPFGKFFLDNSIAKELFSTDKSLQENQEILKELWLYIENIFKELEECKVFELLKSSNDRYNYLLLKQSKIVAMTCTYASLKRNELIKLGFKFDNLLMEESAQISDIESFIPLQLQNDRPEQQSNQQMDDGEEAAEIIEQFRLKRVILIGDHNQLPPIVKNQSLSKFSHFDQSLFTRFIRLEIPHIILDRQARSRPSISELFRWRYKGLQDLDIVKTNDYFKHANGGFAYDYQLINVEESDGFGNGETEPTPHYYQNLGEAEYIVATYQFMRAIGYPSDKITVLTTYNGQKQLLREVFQAKCKSNYGMPHKITTIDKYQGQQNDIILLSLVRTKSYGHLRDPRRLIVAMSRARLGLYVFCKKQFWRNCYETSLVFSKLLKRPDKLVILKSELYDTKRLINSELNQDDCFEVQNSFHMKSIVESN